MARSWAWNVGVMALVGCGTVPLEDGRTRDRPVGSSDPAHPVFVSSWGGFGRDPGQFVEPSSVELTSDGTVLVAGHEHRVQRFTPDGELIDTFGSRGVQPGRFRHPHGLAVDRARGDIVYVGDQNNGRLQTFTATGEFVDAWGDEGFVHIHDVGIDRASGDLFVGDYALHTLRRFSPDGVLLAELGGPGTEPGQFDGVWGVSTDSEGFVYVGDRHNLRVQKLTADGEPVAVWTGFDGVPFAKPTGVYVDEEDTVYVCDSWAATVYLFQPDGTPITAWELDAIYGRPSEPEDLVIDLETGRIYIGEVSGHRVLHLQLPQP